MPSYESLRESDPEVFAATRKRIAPRTRGLVSPEKIIRAVEIATESDFESGCAAEREFFLECMASPQSAGLRHAFFAERGASKVQLHAFDGKPASALPAVEAGYFFSVPPSVVRSPQKQKLVRLLPLTALALESDSPVLGPERGVRNEPQNLAVAVAEIARIKGVPEDEVREVTTGNARRLFF